MKGTFALLRFKDKTIVAKRLVDFMGEREVFVAKDGKVYVIDYPLNIKRWKKKTQ